jgi:hypothetical protein
MTPAYRDPEKEGSSSLECDKFEPFESAKLPKFFLGVHPTSVLPLPDP